ncbi:glycosyltransferase family 2 protein [Cellulomonas dongxiuzhuiae]|uniref:glycosyltransferase family 2 protein n=1 Tax=Cellulomonas dongxiuzhuiae TaxID=2819979 RepID=UPI001AAF8345|nr:glycosyltransferase family 2 protein [Cellulomonas dongxiuzhuiae]MBO3086712.1 glycosyltransferase family 2 protein [Cellulomonas dongxiuzhuiae]
MPTPDRLLVVLPAWNEEITLPAVLAEIRAAVPDAGVLVVSDGSTDRTAVVAMEAGAAVLDLPINLGVGGAMRAGFRYALANGYPRVVQVDADGQHDPTEIVRLLDVAAAEGADVVIGARFAGAGAYQARGPRRWAMRVLSTTLSRLVGTRLTDTTSGFKLSGPRAVRLFAQEYPAEYLGDTVESLVIAHRAGLVVRQAPVAMRPRAGGAPSHGPWRAGVFLARAGLALAVALSRPAPRPVRTSA